MRVSEAVRDLLMKGFVVLTCVVLVVPFWCLGWLGVAETARAFTRVL